MARFSFQRCALVNRTASAPSQRCSARRALRCATFAGVILLVGGGCEILTPGAMQFQQLDATRFVGCGLTETGGQVYCWGIIPGFSTSIIVLHPDSVFPQSTRPRRVPSGAPHRFVSVSNNEGTYCAVSTTGAGFCGGLNYAGTVGDGGGNARRGFATIAGNHVWRQILGGAYHSCGLTTNGDAYCWGQQAEGSLGNDTLPTLSVVPYPLAVSGGHTFLDLSKGREFACGLTAAGEAWCWGFHYGVYLGVGSSLTEPGSGTPVRVSGGHEFVAIESSTSSTCALTRAGEAYCWGVNNNGELGDGTKLDRGVPTRVAGTHRWRRIYPGHVFSCGLADAGALYCWGSNSRGQFGAGAPAEALTPFLVAPAGRYRDVAVGEDHMCALVLNGIAECWGEGVYGQLGDGSRQNRLWPVTVSR